VKHAIHATEYFELGREEKVSGACGELHNSTNLHHIKRGVKMNVYFGKNDKKFVLSHLL
jgi:hypothetical protein